MLNKQALAEMLASVSTLMTANRDYLVGLDQVNGDGDLGISMDDGFRAAAAFMAGDADEDLGKALRATAKVFNESAPSSLGTILSFGLMGMAKSLRGTTEADFATAAQALNDGIDNIMAKAESKPGEKTILDSLVPGARALVEGAADAGQDRESVAVVLDRAAQAAADGSEATREMQAVHGRAAYSAARSIGILDGGSVVGRLVFEGLAAWAH